MGAAILEQTKENAGPGGCGQRKRWRSSRAGSPPPRLCSWCGPGQHGCYFSAIEAIPIAGAAVFGVSQGGRFRLHLLPLSSRRYPRPRAVKEGGMGKKGSLSLNWHHFGEITAPQVLTGLRQPSVPLLSGWAWVQRWPLSAVVNHVPENRRSRAGVLTLGL